MRDGLGIISVGTPAGYVAGDGPYTTIDEDLIIRPIPFNLPANLDNYGSEIPNPWYGHDFFENYLDVGRSAETKVINDAIDMIRQVRGVDNTNYCGWPAVYGGDFSVARQPYDLQGDQLSNFSSEIWDVVWQAARANTLSVQYRLGNTGPWTTREQVRVRDGYVVYQSPEPRDGWKQSPYVFVMDTYINYPSPYPSRSLLVAPHGSDAKEYSIQQFRLVVDNKVIDQFSLNYDNAPWNPVRTSMPIAETLFPGSNPIEPFP